MNECVCRKCGWKYEDPNPNGMGIHQSPIYCIKCDGKMIIRRIDAT